MIRLISAWFYSYVERCARESTHGGLGFKRRGPRVLRCATGFASH